jgi:hypothetical protein
LVFAAAVTVIGRFVMLNADEVALVSAGEDDAVSVYPVPILLIARLLKVATPLTAVRVSVPESVPEPAFVPIARVTCVVLSAVTVAPPASWMRTVTDGEMVFPYTVFEG